MSALNKKNIVFEIIFQNQKNNHVNTDDEDLWKNIKKEYVDNDFVINIEIRNTRVARTLFLKGYSEKQNLNEKNAFFLSNLREEIEKELISQGYIIFPISDRASQYYCKILYPYICNVEHALRHIVYLELLLSYKLNLKSMKNKELSNKDIKTNNQYLKNIFNIVNNMNFSDYIKVLYREPEENDNIKNLDGTKMSKTDKFIANLDKLIKNKDFNFLFQSNSGIDKNELKKIKSLRNDIFHNKQILASDFKSNKRLLSKIKKKLANYISILRKNEIKLIYLEPITATINILATAELKVVKVNKS